MRVVAGATILLFALSHGALGQSPEPPGDAPSQQSEQPEAADLRGTDQMPLSIKIVPNPEAEPIAREEERKRQEAALIDVKVAFETQRIADYTWWLAAFTLVLFGVAVVQAALFLRQLRLIKDQASDARGMAEAAKEAAQLARANLISTHRPRLTIRKVYFPDKDNKEIIAVQFMVVNSGGSPAHIFERNAEIEFFERLPPLPTFSIPDDHGPFTLVSGESREIRREIRATDHDWWDHWNSVEPSANGKAMYLYGFMKYRDDTGEAVREVGFCFKHDGHRFMTVKHVDYTYAD